MVQKMKKKVNSMEGDFPGAGGARVCWALTAIRGEVRAGKKKNP